MSQIAVNQIGDLKVTQQQPGTTDVRIKKSK